MTTLIFGHTNPDTDAINSAMSWAELLKTAGNTDVEAVALGEHNDETQFVLELFKVAAPRDFKTADNETGHVMLVELNEFQTSVADIEDVTIDTVVELHRIAHFHTATPSYYRAEPVGSTHTVIFELFQEHGVEITHTLAGLMASGLISDTLLLKTPTDTEQEQKILPEME